MTLAPPDSEARAPPRRAAHRLFFALWPDADLRRRIDATTAQLEASQGIRGRRLRPQRYVTVLRGMRPPLAGSEIPPLSWQVERFVLVHSQPDDAGYTVLGNWMLAEPGKAQRDTAKRE